MPLSAKLVRKQISLLKPLLNSLSLATIRKGQNAVGELMGNRLSDRVVVKTHHFAEFDGAWVLPRDERRDGMILYLHGGGYTCGDLPYAIGAASLLAASTGTKVFCPAYRLAPEHPFPAALDDAMDSYRYLLTKGYESARITLCGESAGGGLCYALCLRLREEGSPMPCGIIGISPWTDLTASGRSYQTNRDRDPVLTAELLKFYTAQYTDDPLNPLVSPLFGDLSGMPPSLLFVGGDEILLDDTVRLHDRLREVRCDSDMIVADDRWHAYLLYGLEEDRADLMKLDTFLNRVMAGEKKLRWLPLDNAAKIYPAARRQHWSNVFRLSATLTEEIDRDVMQAALDITVRRFPSIAVRLRRGLFWYYLQELSCAPDLREEYSYPLVRMSKEETRRCAFRVIVHGKRVAVEFFHSLTDGNGGLVFLKSLVAEYLQQRYNIAIPAEHGVLARLELPKDEELEDRFPKAAAPVSADRREPTAWHLRGTPEKGERTHITVFSLSSSDVVHQAHAYGVSVTTFLCAAMMMAIARIQAMQVPVTTKRKPIRILLPVNLRTLFPSATLRNFALYTTPEILPALGEYTFEEICNAVKHRMGLDVNPKSMGMKIATNVESEELPIVRVMPLFIKNLVMKAVFNAVGERKSCLSLSNLGVVRVPDAMLPFVERMDFILGVQASAPYNCGVITFRDRMTVSLIRNIREPLLERAFFEVLRERGLSAEVESN